MEKITGFSSNLEDDYLVTISPDGSSENFKVQKAALCSFSEYFDKALSGSFKEKDNRTLRLPGLDADTVQALLYWIYHRQLPDFVDAYENRKARIDAMSRDGNVLVRLWAAGGMYLSSTLQNAVMTQLFELVLSVDPPPNLIRTAYEVSAPGSPLRRLFLQEATRAYTRGHYEEEAVAVLNAVPDFFKDLTDLLLSCPDIRKAYKWKLRDLGVNKKVFMVPEYSSVAELGSEDSPRE